MMTASKHCLRLLASEAFLLHGSVVAATIRTPDTVIPNMNARVENCMTDVYILRRFRA